MPVTVPPLPKPLPIGRGYGKELFYPCPFPGCMKKYKEEGDREMHYIGHMIHNPREAHQLAAKAYTRIANQRSVAPVTSNFAPPTKQQFFGRKVI
jgi:hypothetical protein